MADPAVVNASPLILLTAADLLQLAGQPLLVPEAVASDFQAHGPADATVDMPFPGRLRP